MFVLRSSGESPYTKRFLEKLPSKEKEFETEEEAGKALINLMQKDPKIQYVRIEHPSVPSRTYDAGKQIVRGKGDTLLKRSTIFVK